MLASMPEVLDTANCWYTCAMRKYAVYFRQKQKRLTKTEEEKTAGICFRNSEHPDFFKDGYIIRWRKGIGPHAIRYTTSKYFRGKIDWR